MRKLKTKRNYKKLKPIHESLGEDSSDDEAPSETKKGSSLAAVLGSKSKKISSRFKTSLKKVKKNAAWIKPPDPPVLWNYIDPADTPPDGYFPALRNYAAVTIANIKKLKPTGSDEESAESEEKKAEDSFDYEPRVYVFGGTDFSGRDYKTMDYYNLTTNRWVKFDRATFSGSLPRRRHMSAIACANDQIICIYGGKAPGSPERLRLYECWRRERQRHKRSLKHYDDRQRKLETILEKRKLFLTRDQAKYFSDFHLYNIRDNKMINFKSDLAVHNAHYNRVLPSRRAGHTLNFMNTFSMTEGVLQMIQKFIGEGVSREDEPASNEQEPAGSESDEKDDQNFMKDSPRSDGSDNFSTTPQEYELIKEFRSKGSLLLFGGSAAKKRKRRNTRNAFQGESEDTIECFNDLWRFDLYTMRWFKVDTTGRVPCKTTQHCSAVVRNSMFVYGGVGESCCLWSSLYELKYEKDEWMKFDFGKKKKKESPKEFQRRQKLMSDAVNADINRIGKFTWATVQLMPPKTRQLGVIVPPGLANSQMFPSPSNRNHILIFGGRTADGETWNHTEISTFDISKKKFVKSMMSRGPPKSRSKHAIAVDQRTCTLFLWGDINEKPGVDIGRFPHESKGAELDADNKDILKHEEKVLKVLGPMAECLPHVTSPLNGMVKSRIHLWGSQRKSMVDELELLQSSFPSHRYSAGKSRLGRCDKIRHKVHRLTQTMSGAIRRPWTVGQRESKPGTSKSSRNISTSQSVSKRNTLSRNGNLMSRRHVAKVKKPKPKAKSMSVVATTTVQQDTSTKLLNYDTIVSIKSPKGMLETI